AVASLLMFLCAMRRRSMGKTLRQRFSQLFLLLLRVILFRFCLAHRLLLVWMGRCLRVCVRRVFLAGISVWLGVSGLLSLMRRFLIVRRGMRRTLVWVCV